MTIGIGRQVHDPMAPAMAPNTRQSRQSREGVKYSSELFLLFLKSTSKRCVFIPIMEKSLKNIALKPFQNLPHDEHDKTDKTVKTERGGLVKHILVSDW